MRCTSILFARVEGGIPDSRQEFSWESIKGCCLWILPPVYTRSGNRALTAILGRRSRRAPCGKITGSQLWRRYLCRFDISRPYPSSTAPGAPISFDGFARWQSVQLSRLGVNWSSSLNGQPASVSRLHPLHHMTDCLHHRHGIFLTTDERHMVGTFDNKMDTVGREFSKLPLQFRMIRQNCPARSNSISKSNML